VYRRRPICVKRPDEGDSKGKAYSLKTDSQSRKGLFTETIWVWILDPLAKRWNRIILERDSANERRT
jgi:hypothetical protein